MSIDDQIVLSIKFRENMLSKKKKKNLQKI